MSVHVSTRPQLDLADLRPTSRLQPPLPLPEPRGPVSDALIDGLLRSPWGTRFGPELVWGGAVRDAATDDDLQLAMYLGYELHYRGLAGVMDAWEWQPELVQARQEWEQQLLAGLVARVGLAEPVSAPETVATLTAMAGDDSGPGVSTYLMRDATADQFREFCIHRSAYHLKEADPHSWGIPRLSGPVKSTLIAIQADEYGNGLPGAMHAELFAELMQSHGLDTAYGHYLSLVPGVTLLATNLITLFGLHRRWRGALVGHLAYFEMTSSVPNGRYARGHRRLGGSERGARFFDEHVVADSVHEQLAAYGLAGGLVEQEPELSADVIFGARCAQLADELFADHVLPRWRQGESSLLGARP